ncbi:MAG TPA: hypothetical protein VME46_24970 [Acidimicrobiales bacterium]|nr:hypothetical protein [Acidimicrobiales bacterium]
MTVAPVTTRPAPAVMVATPALSAPAKAVAGQHVNLSGVGFRAGAKIKIVLAAPRPVVVGSVQAKSDGTFKASVVVPRHVQPGKGRVQVVGAAPTGHLMSLAAPVVILSDHPAAVVAAPGPSVAAPVLLTVAVVLPLVTWLLLELLGSRSRRLIRRPGQR